MNHPDDLLADYVDGTLRGPGREAVAAHLSVCERCREDAVLATAALRALATMQEPPIPTGIGDVAIRAAEGTAPAHEASHGRRAAALPPWFRWIGAAAAAAAVLLVLALVLPSVGQGPGRGADRAVSESGGVDVPPATVVERIAGDLGTEEVQALALSYRAGPTATPNTEAGGAPMAADATKGIATGRVDPATPDEALACLRTAFPPLTGDPVRLLRTRFQGTPAYVGVFLSGPGAGQPADTVTVIVAAIKDCRILSSTRARL